MPRLEKFPSVRWKLSRTVLKPTPNKEGTIPLLSHRRLRYFFQQRTNKKVIEIIPHECFHRALTVCG